MDELICEINQLENNNIRLELFYKNNFVGVMYFTLGKVGFNRKPISINNWICVDAKIFGLYDYIDTDPSELVNFARNKIQNYLTNLNNK
jgi:hypothetical protein